MTRRLLSYLLPVVLVGGFAWASYHIKAQELRDNPSRAAMREEAARAANSPYSSAAGFTLKSLDGKEVSLSDFAGKNFVLVAFWVSWNPGSRGSMPSLVELDRKYGSQGLKVICIDKRESRDAVEAFTRKVKCPSLVLLDEDGSISDSYSVKSFPTFVLVDKDGNMRLSVAGIRAMSGYSLERDICRHMGITMQSPAMMRMGGYGRNRGM